MYSYGLGCIYGHRCCRRRADDRDASRLNLVVGRTWKGTAFGGVKGRTELPGYVERYMSGQIELDSLVTHTMPLDDINRAFDLMHKGEKHPLGHYLFKEPLTNATDRKYQGVRRLS
jgi:hypothetical protein